MEKKNILDNWYFNLQFSRLYFLLVARTKYSKNLSDFTFTATLFATEIWRASRLFKFNIASRLTHISRKKERCILVVKYISRWIFIWKYLDIEFSMIKKDANEYILVKKKASVIAIQEEGLIQSGDQFAKINLKPSLATFSWSKWIVINWWSFYGFEWSTVTESQHKRRGKRKYTICDA